MSTAIDTFGAAYTSFDHMALGDIAKLTGWSGSATAIAQGLDGYGQAVTGPTNLDYTFAGSTWDTVHVVFRFRPNQITAIRSIVEILVGTTLHVKLQHTAAGVLQVVVGSPAVATYTSTAGPITANNVYLLEFVVYVHDTLGAFTVLRNGVADTQLTRTNVDTKNDPTQPNRCRWNNADCTIDDVIVRTGLSGWLGTDLMSNTSGSPKMRTGFPRAKGTYEQFTPVGFTGDHYLGLDETQMDGTTTELSELTQNERESWYFDNLPTNATTIIDVMTVYAVRNRVSGEQVRHFFRLSGTDYDHAAAAGTLGTTHDFEERRWAVSPATSGPWTLLEHKNAQAGVKRDTPSNTDEVYITQGVVVTIFNVTEETSQGGGQILPTFDTFAQGISYGTAANLYLRVQPTSSADAATGYAVDFRWGTLHDGYINDPAAPSGGGAAFFKDSFAAGAAEAMCTAAGRIVANLADGEVILYPRVVRPYGGTLTTSSTRWVAVLGRIQAGTFVTPGGGNYCDEYVRDVSCYMFLHANASGVGHRLFVLRFINGAITKLADAPLPPQSGVGQRTPMKMRMRITGSVTPQITCWFQTKQTVAGQLVIQDVQVFNVIDSSPGVLTGAGRWGFGGQSTRLESSFTTAVEFDSFEIYDINFAFTPMRDLWQRWERRAMREQNEVVPITQARSLMCDWTGDLHGMRAGSTSDTKDHFGHLVANSAQVEVGQNFTVGSGQVYGYYIRERSAASVDQHRSVSITPTTNDASVQRHMGIVLRTTLNYPSTMTIELQGNVHRRKGGYLFIVFRDPAASPNWQMRYFHLDSTQTAIGATPTLLAQVDLTAFALSLGTQFVLDCEVLNFASGGLPGLRAIINGSAVVPTAFDVLVSGIQVVSGWLVDTRSSASTSGFGEGFFFLPGSTATQELALYDTWTELTRSDPPALGDDDQISVEIKSEQDGVTGTLTFPISWPVTDVSRFDKERYDFEIPRPAIFLKYKKGRRAWSVGARGCSTTERQTLLTFVDAHRTCEIPFYWTPPVETTPIIVHFSDPKIRTALVGPANVEDFDFELEELLDY